MLTDILIYGVFTLSMVCVVAYFALPAIRRLKKRGADGGEPDATDGQDGEQDG